MIRLIRCCATKLVFSIIATKHVVFVCLILGHGPAPKAEKTLEFGSPTVVVMVVTVLLTPLLRWGGVAFSAYSPGVPSTIDVQLLLSTTGIQGIVHTKT